MVDTNARFISRAYINDKKVDMTDHWLMLKDNSPGNCQLKVKSAPNKLDIVAVDLGWGEMIDRVFIGYVERVMPAEAGWSLIFCREVAASLAFNLSVMLRHPTLRQVISEISEQTGLEFVLPDKPYSDTAIPCFYCDSSGYAMLDNLGRTYKVPDFIWQQQGNGKIYLGSYQDSFWHDKPIIIPNNLMTNHQAGKTVSMPAAPMVRPNVTANNERIKSVEFKGTNMTITWG
ncbi:hypothetical protein [Shewanella baltica]|uniref:Uncharacterized protein n=1 Tax=Shewanella baltica (strain OS155 / ATCC BAA-1091) TaxID=325240 RepID=A3D259_SHEB5|nr:hypothetical protein [Shewanella baltica]ABN60822.1 conserved hypothetical protein [Shewanella baltica OS155]